MINTTSYTCHEGHVWPLRMWLPYLSRISCSILIKYAVSGDHKCISALLNVSVRKWKRKSGLGKEGKWEFEIGEDMRPVNLDADNISESRGNVSCLRTYSFIQGLGTVCCKSYVLHNNNFRFANVSKTSFRILWNNIP